METVNFYIIKNQYNQYISKQREWLDGSEPKLLFKTKNHDEALNWVFELSLKDTQLRAFAETCELDDKLLPIVEVLYQAPLALEDDLTEEEPLEPESEQEPDQETNTEAE